MRECCFIFSGMCSVPPIVRSQQWKPGRGTQLRCSYKARCPACWLKMCLRSFNMPDTLRENMSLMLPPEMRKGLDKLSMNHLCVRFENNSSFMKHNPLESDKVPRIPMLGTAGLKTCFFPTNNDGKGVAMSAFNSGLRVQRKSSLSSIKTLKHNKQKDYDKGHGEKNKRDKHLHSNKLLKKASKKLGKSKGK